MDEAPERVESYVQLQGTTDVTASPTTGGSRSVLLHFNPPASVQVINNQDLVHMIFDALREEEHSATDSPTAKTTWKRRLAPLLSVNRSFFQTTSEYLWETMHSLLPLFRLLPAFQEDYSGFTLNGIQNTDWTRLILYAKLVKHLNLQSCLLGCLSERWISVLLLHTSTTRLLPNYRLITCSHKARSGLKLLALAMGPALQRISLSLQPPPGPNFAVPAEWPVQLWDDPERVHEACALVASLAYLAPNLSSLMYTGPLTKAFCTSIGDLKLLTTLDITITNDADFPGLLPLTRLTRLESLRLVFLRMSNSTTIDALLFKSRPLPKLTRFEFVGGSWNFEGAYLYTLPSSLHSCDIRFTRLTSSDLSLTDLLEDNPSLEELVVSVPPGVTLSRRTLPSDTWSQATQEELLDKLIKMVDGGTLSKVDLTHLPLFTERMVAHARHRLLSRTAADVPAGGKALTSLRFHVPSIYNVEGRADWHATPETLHRLAFHGCTTLKHLELQFTDTCFSAVPLVEPPDSKFSNHGLETLVVRTDSTTLGLSMREKISVAVFLDALFPSLQRVSGTASAEWEDVDELVRALRTRAAVAVERHQLQDDTAQKQ